MPLSKSFLDDLKILHDLIDRYVKRLKKEPSAYTTECYIELYLDGIIGVLQLDDDTLTVSCPSEGTRRIADLRITDRLQVAKELPRLLDLAINLNEQVHLDLNDTIYNLEQDLVKYD